MKYYIKIESGREDKGKEAWDFKSKVYLSELQCEELFFLIANILDEEEE